jgi:hypothetical protein
MSDLDIAVSNGSVARCISSYIFTVGASGRCIACLAQ